ncbi:MAG: hypothetical protein ACREUT_17600 [Steroidobacteraceae bacterium]
MQRIPLLLVGMLFVAILAASCGASSDSAMPAAQASQVGWNSSSSASSSSMVASSSSSSSGSSSSTASQSSSSSASGSASSSSSASGGAPAAVPLFAATIDLGAINFEPDVPVWPTMGCQGTPGSAADQAGGNSYVCLSYSSPTSTQFFAVGYLYFGKGNQGPYHAVIYCNGCGGNGIDGGVDLGVAPGGTSSEAVDFSGTTIVGFGNAADGQMHALAWPHDSAPAELLPMPPGVSAHVPSSASAVNSAGEIVGTYGVANDPQNVGERAVLWEPDASAPDGSGYVAYDISSLLPAAAAGLVLADAYAITCEGDIAADGVPAVWQGDAASAALHPHRYLIARQGGNGASCPP